MGGHARDEAAPEPGDRAERVGGGRADAGRAPVGLDRDHAGQDLGQQLRGGAVAGALLIAFVEMFGAAYFSPHMRDLYVFVILIVVLLFKPSGLFGRPVVIRV